MTTDDERRDELDRALGQWADAARAEAADAAFVHATAGLLRRRERMRRWISVAVVTGASLIAVLLPGTSAFAEAWIQLQPLWTSDGLHALPVFLAAACLVSALATAELNA